MLKEMVVMVGGKATMVLALGAEGLDVQKLGEVLGEAVELPKAGDLKRAGVANVCEISVVDWTGPLVVDSSLKDLGEERVVASTGYFRLLAILPASALFKLIGNKDQRVVEVPRTKIPPAVEAPAASEAEPEASAPAAAAAPKASETAEVVPLAAAAAAGAEKEVTERENSGRKDGKKVAGVHRVASEDGVVKVALEST